MNPDQLRPLLRAPEDAFLERKPDAEIRQMVIALANSVPEVNRA
jgi:hypothetical protein